MLAKNAAIIFILLFVSGCGVKINFVHKNAYNTSFGVIIIDDAIPEVFFAVKAGLSKYQGKPAGIVQLLTV